MNPAARRTVVLLGAAAAMLSARFAWQKLTARPAAPAEFYAYAAADRALQKLWTAPGFAYPDQHGLEVTSESLRGRPWIADFIYTTCTSACPMMTSRMVLLQRALAGVDVRFVSFSVDPQHDTPPVLDRYARGWNAAETRWSLLSTDATRLGDTLSGFRVTAQAASDPASPIVHSSVFLLVDADGWVRGVYDGNDGGARTRLEADTRRLAGPVAVPSAGEAGGDVYAALGCGGCHADARIAPSLDGLGGATVALDDGTKVTADDAYLRRSILEPAAQIVAGYPPTMPSYAGSLSDEQLAVLVRRLAAPAAAVAASTAAASSTVVAPATVAASTSGPRRGQAVAAASSTPAASIAPGLAPAEVKAAGDAPAPPAATLATDPVCGMPVHVGPETLHVTRDGRELFFCSPACRDSFVANPAKFRPPGG